MAASSTGTGAGTGSQGGASSRGSGRAPGSMQGSAGGGAKTIERTFGGTLCAFWLGKQCYAIAADIVGEVVAVETLTAVPLAPPAIRGIFNLRGTPMAVVDLPRALDLPIPDASLPRAGQGLPALVLRAGDLLVAALIDRMEMVVPPGRGRFRPRSEGNDENALVQGFLEITQPTPLVLTVLGSDEIMARLAELRFRRADEV
jgi:chemotaxis signal transduction protein